MYVHAKKIARKTKKEQSLFFKEFDSQLEKFCEKVQSLGFAKNQEEDIFEKYYQEYEKLNGIKIVDFCREKGLDAVVFREYRRKRLHDK